MVYEGGGSTFALGAGDADDEVVVYLKEEVGLRRDGGEVAKSLKLHGGDARRFDD